MRPPVWLIMRISVPESERTGSFDTSSFHALLAGNTRQPPTFGGDGVAWADTVADALGTVMAATSAAIRATSRRLRRADMGMHRPDARPTLNGVRP